MLKIYQLITFSFVCAFSNIFRKSIYDWQAET